MHNSQCCHPNNVRVEGYKNKYSKCIDVNDATHYKYKYKSK